MIKLSFNASNDNTDFHIPLKSEINKSFISNNKLPKLYEQEWIENICFDFVIPKTVKNKILEMLNFNKRIINQTQKVNLDLFKDVVQIHKVRIAKCILNIYLNREFNLLPGTVKDLKNMIIFVQKKFITAPIADSFAKCKILDLYIRDKRSINYIYERFQNSGFAVTDIEEWITEYEESKTEYIISEKEMDQRIHEMRFDKLQEDSIRQKILKEVELNEEIIRKKIYQEIEEQKMLEEMLIKTQEENAQKILIKKQQKLEAREQKKLEKKAAKEAEKEALLKKAIEEQEQIEEQERLEFQNMWVENEKDKDNEENKDKNNEIKVKNELKKRRRKTCNPEIQIRNDAIYKDRQENNLKFKELALKYNCSIGVINKVLCHYRNKK